MKKYTKRLFLSILMLLSVVGVSALVWGGEQSVYKKSSTAYSSGSPTAYYTSVQSAAAAARKQFKERKQTIAVGLKVSKYSERYPELVWDEMFKHTGVPTEGDYMKWQWQDCSYNFDYKQKSDGYYYIDIYYDFRYYTTKAQEDQVTQRLNLVMSQMQLQTKSDYMKIKTIYDYICKTVVYDSEHVLNEKYTKQYTAYAALIEKTAVCQGYGVLFYRMCLQAGIDCHFIKGYAGGNQREHAWNIVKLKNQYYYVDATWDAGYSQYNYFLKGYMNFGDHIPEEEYVSESFKTQFPVAAQDYKIVESDTKTFSVLSIPQLQSVKNVDGGQKVTWSAVSTAKSYNVYRRTGSGSFKKVGITSNTYLLDKTVVSGTSYEYAVEAVRDSTTSGYKSSGKQLLYLEAPILSKAANAAKGQLLTWKAVKGASCYYVYYRTVNGSWTKLGKTSSLSYQTTKVKSGSKYIYTVRAVKGSICSGYVAKGLSKMYLSSPALTLGNYYTGVKLTWENIKGAEKYYIFRKIKGQSWVQIAVVTNPKTVTYIDKSAKNGYAYYYCIMPYAASATNKSAYKGIVRLATHTIKDCKSTKCCGVTVTWNRNPYADGYYICYRQGNTLKYVKVNGNTNLTKTITGIRAGKYKIYVRGYKKYGSKYYYSSWSQAKDVVVK